MPMLVSVTDDNEQGPDVTRKADAYLVSGRSRETALRRDAHGRWFDGRVPLKHPRLEAAFDRWLESAADGRFRLRNAINWAYVTVEGAPRTVKSVKIDSMRCSIVLSSGDHETLQPETLFQDAAGNLYCRAGKPAMWARFHRDAMQALERHLADEGGSVVLRLFGTVIPIPVRPAP